MIKLALVLLFAGTLGLGAAPVPHATRAGRWVETREGFSVEYSPGQEAWMEMAFARLHAEAAPPIPPATLAADTAAVPGSPRDLRERREAILAAVAREIGRSAPLPVQAKAFDTFLGYYEVLAEMYRLAAVTLGERLQIHQVAIWQRDELIRRLREGEKIPGVSYDPATDSGNFAFGGATQLDDATSTRIKEIYAAIKAQQLAHTFKYDQAGLAASVTPNAPPSPEKKPADTPAAATTTPFEEIVMPVLYRGPFETAPDAKAFDYTWVNLRRVGDNLEQSFHNYVDPNLVGVILHETTEIGLIDAVIASKDRRWLCDGTANYSAWKVSREFFGGDFAQRVYDLDAKLREYAAWQPKINLARWSAAERQDAAQHETDLNRAHYVFATRGMFILAQRQGDDALATLWQDVAKTDYKKANAKTFAAAYRKRYKGDLAALVKSAEKTPIPAGPASPPSVKP